MESARGAPERASRSGPRHVEEVRTCLDVFMCRSLISTASRPGERLRDLHDVRPIRKRPDGQSRPSCSSLPSSAGMTISVWQESAIQVRPIKIDTGQVDVTQVDAAQIRTTQVHISQVCSAEVRILQVSVTQNGVA